MPQKPDARREPAKQYRFLAIAVSQTKYSCRETNLVYTASHPEIAYQLAVKEAKEERYQQKFRGISRLEECPPDAGHLNSQGADESILENLPEKSALAAFNDPRWAGVPVDEEELASALRGPPNLFEVVGLDQIPWNEYTHAYGPATDVPRDIQRLASSSAEVRKRAIWELFGSIIHQGSIYPATPVAIPFLLDVLDDPRLLDRPDVAELLDAIADEGEFSRRIDKVYEQEIGAAIRQTFLDKMPIVHRLTKDDDKDVRRFAMSILRNLK